MQITRVRGGRDEGQRSLCPVALGLRLNELARSVDRVALFVEKLFDAHDVLNVFAAIEALSSIAFIGLELRKLSLPEAEHIGRQRAKL